MLNQLDNLHLYKDAQLDMLDRHLDLHLVGSSQRHILVSLMLRELSSNSPPGKDRLLMLK